MGSTACIWILVTIQLIAMDNKFKQSQLIAEKGRANPFPTG